MSLKAHTTIPRKAPGLDVYSRLQESALKQVQRYAGELWSDYNEHDPGVTIMDALNYSLLEMDYRLQFPLPDYLTPPTGRWNPVENLLFAPEQVFPALATTETDYRKLFMTSIDDLKNVWATADRNRGTYHFVLDTPPDTTPRRQDEILNEARALYHTNRNLCERLGSIRFATYRSIVPRADIELEEYADTDALMARLCFEIEEFLNAGIRFRRINELPDEGEAPDELLDGPLQRRMLIDSQSIRKRKEEFDLLALRGRLANLRGVVRVNELSFDVDGRTVTDFLPTGHELQLYTISSSQIDAIRLRKHGKEIAALPDQVRRMWNIIRTEQYGLRGQDDDLDALRHKLSGTYRDLFSHRPLLNDLPAFYRKNNDLQGYLDVFDRFVSGVLSELKELPGWMRAESGQPLEKQEAWLDMLDLLYDTESNPEYLKKTEGRIENRLRRTAFLSDIPRWGYERGRGRDLTDCSPRSLSGIEWYMERLFNLPKYALRAVLIEHCLLGPDEKGDTDMFSISVVFSADDKYLINSEFRDCCEQILLSRTPAHIRLRVRWTDRQGLKRLEADHDLWKYLLSASACVGLDELSHKIKRRLEDDNNWYGEV